MTHRDDVIRVVAVDDHPLVREGIGAILAADPGMQLLATVDSGASAIEAFRRLRPDVTLMALQMPGIDGVEAIEAIRAEFPMARILVLTTYRLDARASAALRAGASGVLLKSALRRELLDTLRAIHAGRKFVQAEVAREIAEHAMDGGLTAREIDVLRLVADGRSNKVVGTTLGISEDTVKAHMKNILSKLDARDRTHAVAICLRRGILGT